MFRVFVVLKKGRENKVDDDLFFVEKPLSFCCFCVPFFSFFKIEKEEEEEEHDNQTLLLSLLS